MNTNRLFPTSDLSDVLAQSGTDDYAKSPLYQEDIARIAASEDMQALASKRVLVTGAAGLIGTVLVDSMMEANRHGARIRIIAADREMVRSEVRFARHAGSPDLVLVEMNVRDPMPEDHPFDVCIAAASNTSPLDYAAHPTAPDWRNYFA